MCLPLYITWNEINKIGFAMSEGHSFRMPYYIYWQTVVYQ